MIVNKYQGNGGGGGYVLPTATDSRLGGVKVGSGLSIDSGGTLTSEGGVTQYDLDSMSQSERAAFVAMCENLTELEREELFVYRDKSICRYDHTEGSGDSFKIGFFDYRQDGWSYPLTYFRHFFVNADGTYESLGNGSYPNVITFDTTYADTAHTLSNSDNLSPLIPISNLNAESEGRVAINLRLIIQRTSPAKVVLSSKAWSERTGTFEGRICAEWHYSGNVITAVWNVVEHTATIASWTEVPEGGSGGPTIVNLDTLSQAELTALYEQLSGETTASTVNEDYIFLKSFTQVHGGNKVPFRVQFLGYFSYKVRFGYCKPDNGHEGEIWLLFVDVKDNGEMETSMVPNYTFPGLQRLQLLNSRDYIKYDFTTSTFSTNRDGDTMFTGDTCSGAWVFNADRNQNAFNGAYAPEYVLRITDTDVENRKLMNPVVSYDTLSTPVMLTDSQGAERPFGYIFYFDYGKYTLSMYVDWDQQRYARLSIVKN